MKKILFPLLFVITLASCNKQENKTETLTLASPNGAPSLSMLDLMYENKDSVDILNDSQVIKASMLNESYDLIIAPANLGAQMYNASSNYYMVAGLTFGNLYLVSKTQFNTISDLSNFNFISFGKGTITDLVSSYVLEENNLNLNTSYLSSTSDTKAAFISSTESNEVYLLADPIYSVLKSSFNENSKPFYSISLTSKWNELTQVDGFLQAALFVKKDTYQKRLDLVNSYLDKIEESINNLNNEKNISLTNQKIKDLNIFDFSDEVMLNAIKGSNIRYLSGLESRMIFETTYSKNLGLIGGKLPDEEFYK